jgi:peptidyl-prolyl cis-trans isomerase SurA
MKKSFCFWSACVLFVPAFAAAQTQSRPQSQPPSQESDKGQVIEEVVARVNSEVITRGDLERAQKSLVEDTHQDCPTCTPAQVDERVAGQQKDLLRDLIDNSLMEQRGKDVGINVDADVVKRMDEIRQQNNIASMEDLEKQVTASGLDFEDFKNQIKNQLITQEVIRREVGSRVVLEHAEILKYYEDHKAEFVRPEQVVVREIFVSTENKTEAEIPALKKKADGLLDRVKMGDDFGELAKRFSDGSTAKQGGDLGTFEKGQLATNLEQVVFKLQRNETTNVIEQKNGFLILQVREHYPAGQQPEEKVDTEISNKLYDQKMKPALREYLDMLRQDSYVEVKPGYVDSAEVTGSGIDEVPPESEDAKKKGPGHKFLFFGKKKTA